MHRTLSLLVVCLIILGNAHLGLCQSEPLQTRTYPAVRNEIQQHSYEGDPRPPSVQSAFSIARSDQSLPIQDPKGSRNQFARTVSSLGVVAGLMLGFLWWSRKQQVDNAQVVPNDLVQVIGCVPLDAKHKAHLVRFGDQILLLSLEGTGVSKIAEINVQTTERTQTIRSQNQTAGTQEFDIQTTRRTI